ncbi:phosphate ABC transporter substrate-binding protein PstS [Streptomyces sp. NPDC050804]|uniref:phosphate ABC transporter substrate-binding protein PstS n=1 Tax=Streptomyces sp. NPDC050804 TaxID=3154745 RepID=UPI0034219440
MAKALTADDPEQVGPYRITGRLGVGGMGRVYLAASPGGRQVAVKVIRPELADEPGFRERFAREASAAQAVSGAFTAAVVGVDADGEAPWLATLYVPGLSLAEAVGQHGTLPERSVYALGAGLAEALQAIHAAGLIHRDLKPSNVLLAPDGPRVIDFGIAMEAGADALTSTGLIIGTPGFMAPEQFTRRTVGPAADVFCLGAVLAFAAGGHGPFGTGSAHAMGYRVVHEEPDLAGLPVRVRDIVARCLAKDPDVRPTVPQLLHELAVLVAAGPQPGPDAAATTVVTADDRARTLALALGQSPWLPSPLAAAVGRVDHSVTAPADPRPAAPVDPRIVPPEPKPDSEPRPEPEPTPEPEPAPVGPEPVPAAPRPARPAPAAAAVPDPPATPTRPPSWARKHRTKMLIGGLVAAAVASLTPLANDAISGRNGTDEPNFKNPGAQASGSGTPDDSGALSFAPVCDDSGQSLVASGSSVQQNAMDIWIKNYTADCPDTQITYTPSGSGAGVSDFVRGLTAFSGSDTALKPAEVEQSRSVCQGGGRGINLPMLGSPVALVHNLPGVDDLVLDAPAVAKIYAGKITRWNDAAIRELNPDVDLPATSIQALHRSSASAVNQTLSRYLSATAGPDDWPYTPGADWLAPGGVGVQTSSAVVEQLKQVDGSIGYVELTYAISGGLDTVSLRTGAAQPVEPAMDSASQGIAASRVVGTGKDLALDLDYTTSAEGAYPLLLVTYEIVCDKGNLPGTLGALKSFLTYTAGEEGQRAVRDMGYAPLPAELAARVRETVRTIA